MDDLTHKSISDCNTLTLIYQTNRVNKSSAVGRVNKSSAVGGSLLPLSQRFVSKCFSACPKIENTYYCDARTVAQEALRSSNYVSAT